MPGPVPKLVVAGIPLGSKQRWLESQLLHLARNHRICQFFCILLIRKIYKNDTSKLDGGGKCL